MADTSVLQLRLRLSGWKENEVPSNVIVEAIQALEEEAFHVDHEEIESLVVNGSDCLTKDENALVKQPNIRKEIFDRLGASRGRVVVFTSAAPGSIILIGLVAAAGLASWVVEKTVGKSFGEAYEGSDLHKALVRFFSSRLSVKGKKLATRLERRSGSTGLVYRAIWIEPDGILVIDVVALERLPANLAPNEDETARFIQLESEVHSLRNDT